MAFWGTPIFGNTRMKVEVISRKPLEVTNRSFGKKRQPVMFVGEIPLATIYFLGQIFVFRDL